MEIENKRKILHLIMVPFTDVGIGTAFRDDKWLEYRIKIFNEYTLKSLVNQSNKDFILWISMSPKEKTSPALYALYDALHKAGIKYVVTWNGLMYHDDKFGGNLWQCMKNVARVFRRCWRNKAWHELWPLLQELKQNEQKNETLYTRIDRAIMMLIYAGLPNLSTDYVYLTRLDSDDMLHTRAVQEIQDVAPEHGAITMSKGYILNRETGQLAYWLPLTNPPFHTIIFPGRVFFDAKEHLAYYKDFTSHEDIPRIFPHYYPMHNWRYCVLVHSQKHQISTIFNHPFRGEEITDPAKTEALKQFGL